jgi:hypothetical protein
MCNRRVSVKDHFRGLTGSYPFGLLLAVLCCCAVACSKQPPPAELRPISISNSPAPSPAFPALAQATPTPSPLNATPTAPEVEEVANAIARVFGNSARVAQDHAPAFFVGDFNGDGSQDLAAVTRASDDALPEINSELANWTLEDPHAVPVPGSKTADQSLKPKTVKAERNDQLLAIIHGVGPEGWRNTEARQTFLLRNAVGMNATLQTAARLRESPSNSNLSLRGDAISETVKGHRGLIFWTGAKYAWAPQP